jgi:hypothetical protein
MPTDWSQQFVKELEDEKLQKQKLSNDYRSQRTQEYSQLGTQIQDILTHGQVMDKASGSMRPLSPEEKTQLKTTQEHVQNYLKKLSDPNVDPISGNLHEDPLHRLTDKLHLTKPPEQKGQTAEQVEKEAGETRTQFGGGPEQAGAEKRQETERNIEQFRDLAKKYGLPERAVTQITEKMLGGPGAIPKEKWKTIQGTIDGQATTFKMDESTGEFADLAGNPVPPEMLAKFQMAQKPPTSTQLNVEAYENAFDPPVKWAEMKPEQKAYYPEWIKRQSAAITTGQHVMMVTQADGSVKPVVVQTVSERQPGAGGGTPAPPGMRGKSAAPAKTGGAPAKKAGGKSELGDPKKGWGVSARGAGVVSVGDTIGAKTDKYLKETEANLGYGVARAKQMHSDLDTIKQRKKETGQIDQQAMLSILFNHIGMTSGAQKGTRITQTMIDEAQESAPFVARLLTRIGVGNNLDEMGLRGVVLTEDQMDQMIDLADRKVKVLQDQWKDARKNAPGPPLPDKGDAGASDDEDIIKALKGK